MANILIVDDNIVIRDVITLTLHDYYTVTTANNGKEGIDLATTSLFDLIITDINMPIMNGVEFVTEIRKNKTYASTPILIVTANIEVDEQAIKACGASGWIIKPFKPEKLLESVDTFMKKKCESKK